MARNAIVAKNVAQHAQFIAIKLLNCVNCQHCINTRTAIMYVSRFSVTAVEPLRQAEVAITAIMAILAIMAIHKPYRLLYSTILLICFSALAVSDSITGKVFNQTTGRPAAGDDVVLVKAGDLNQEQAHTKTDAQGVFTFNDIDAKTVYVVRVLHQGVNYDHN